MSEVVPSIQDDSDRSFLFFGKIPIPRIYEIVKEKEKQCLGCFLRAKKDRL